MIYKFNLMGCIFECDLDDDNVVSTIRKDFGDKIDTILKNKDSYIVYNDVERLDNLDTDNASLWYDLMSKDMLLESHEQDIADIFYMLMGGNITNIGGDE